MTNNRPVDYVKEDYGDTEKTILKKYLKQPKTIKKLFGKEPAIVKDSKGNTWYEFDIPETFKKGKGQIKAYNKGGEMLRVYDDYINGLDNSSEAQKTFDKLNRIYYNKAKENNMSPSDYIMTYLIN